MEITEPEIKRFAKALEDGEKQTRRILSIPIVQERGRHRRNWASHLQILVKLDQLFCPCCGNPASTHLKWVCHSDLSMEESKEKAKDNFGESTEREDINPCFWNEEVKKKALNRLDKHFGNKKS